jgi:hypothetical protein
LFVRLLLIRQPDNTMASTKLGPAPPLGPRPHQSRRGSNPARICVMALVTIGAPRFSPYRPKSIPHIDFPQFCSWFLIPKLHYVYKQF